MITPLAIHRHPGALLEEFSFGPHMHMYTHLQLEQGFNPHLSASLTLFFLIFNSPCSKLALQTTHHRVYRNSTIKNN